MNNGGLIPNNSCYSKYFFGLNPHEYTIPYPLAVWHRSDASNLLIQAAKDIRYFEVTRPLFRDHAALSLISRIVAIAGHVRGLEYDSLCEDARRLHTINTLLDDADMTRRCKIFVKFGEHLGHVVDEMILGRLVCINNADYINSLRGTVDVDSEQAD